MAAFPLAAAVVALAFAALLGKQLVSRRRPYHALWALALGMFAVASFLVFLGVVGGWSAGEFRAYWLLGAVLTVPYLAMGELYLLIGRRWITTALFLLLLFGTALAMSRVRSAILVKAGFAVGVPVTRRDDSSTSRRHSKEVMEW